MCIRRLSRPNPPSRIPPLPYQPGPFLARPDLPSGLPPNQSTGNTNPGERSYSGCERVNEREPMSIFRRPPFSLPLLVSTLPVIASLSIFAAPAALYQVSQRMDVGSFDIDVILLRVGKNWIECRL